MNFSFEELNIKLKKINLTQKEFAEILGISKTTISKWKTKNKAPKYAFIVIDYLEDIYIKNKKLSLYKNKGNI